MPGVQHVLAKEEIDVPGGAALVVNRHKAAAVGGMNANITAESRIRAALTSEPERSLAIYRPVSL